MLPGPDQVIACPHCQALARYESLLSGNTFGAVYWSDGSHSAPMMPLPSAVMKCGSCTECYWLSDATKVGKFETWSWLGREEEVDPAWKAAPFAQEPDEEEYCQAIEKGLAKDEKQERDLRLFAWWRRNDAYRHSCAVQSDGVAGATGKCRENLEALVDLLDEADENDLVMKAEVLRQLGEFEAAKLVLSRVKSTEHTAAFREIRALCDAGDIFVRQLHLDS